MTNMNILTMIVRWIYILMVYTFSDISFQKYLLGKIMLYI